MGNRWALLWLAALTLPVGSASFAAKVPSGPPPAQITGLLACRSVAGEAERLACYDKAAAAIESAVSNKDLVVFDREGVKKTKRGLFGFGIPNLGIFGDDDDSVELKQLDGVIAGIGRTSDGGHIIRLEDGSKWAQIDTRTVYIDPRVGDKVVVKKGALGSYIVSVNGQPGFKVKRIA